MIRFPNVPSSFDADQRQFLRGVFSAINLDDVDRVKRNVGVSQIILVSPDKSMFALTVEDDGTLTTTLIQEG